MTSYRTGFDRVNPCVSPVWPDAMDDRYWPEPAEPFSPTGPADPPGKCGGDVS